MTIAAHNRHVISREALSVAFFAVMLAGPVDCSVDFSRLSKYPVRHPLCASEIITISHLRDDTLVFPGDPCLWQHG
jgi:hypothetical protein